MQVHCRTYTSIAGAKKFYFTNQFALTGRCDGRPDIFGRFGDVTNFDVDVSGLSEGILADLEIAGYSQPW